MKQPLVLVPAVHLSVCPSAVAAPGWVKHRGSAGTCSFFSPHLFSFANASGACTSLLLSSVHPGPPVHPGLRGLGNQDIFEAQPGCELATGQHFPQGSPLSSGMCKAQMRVSTTTSCSHLSLAEPKDIKLLLPAWSSCLLAEQLLLSQGFPGLSRLSFFFFFPFGV